MNMASKGKFRARELNIQKNQPWKNRVILAGGSMVLRICLKMVIRQFP
jgi:hypothetical protein